MAKEKVKTLPKRSEVPVEYTWRLEDIFPTDEDWEREFGEIKKLLPKAQEFKGTLGESAGRLLELLRFQEQVYFRLGKLYTYAHMRYDQDTTNQFYQGLNARANTLHTEAASAFSFVVPEILSIPEEKIERFLEENQELQLYRHYFDKINLKRPHVLSPEVEEVLAKSREIADTPDQVFGMLNHADLHFPTIVDENGEEAEVTHGRFVPFLESRDRRVRRDAFKAVYDTYEKFKNTFAATLSGQIKADNFYALVRKYRSARHAALANNNIPEEVYDNLVATVNKNLHLLHRYVRLRKKALGVDELHMYDLYTPLVKDVEMKVTYEEAKECLLKALAPLGEEYLAVLKEGFQNRWVDVLENKGKRSGAYSSGSYGTNPYILLNWQDDVKNLFTLAHEFGHSVHSYFTRKNQPFVYGNYSIFVAEVASTCNEALLTDYLLKTLDDERKRLYIVNHYLEDFRTTLFRQTMFAEFEHEIHVRAQNGEALTAELLTDLYYNLNKKYFGNDIVVDREIGMEWARIPHFYYNYYVYQYSTGFSAAQALSKQILTEGKPAVERYLAFLKAGSSDYPIEVLKKAGVDMTKVEPIQAAFTLFEKRLEEMENLLG